MFILTPPLYYKKYYKGYQEFKINIVRMLLIEQLIISVDNFQMMK